MSSSGMETGPLNQDFFPRRLEGGVGSRDPFGSVFVLGRL